MPKFLPIGMQSFQNLRENNDFVYVDKTIFIQQMLNFNPKGKYFLSRPRRFGKSLFLDTLKYMFEGKKSLFKGLFIEDKWDWNDIYPVIKISFGAGVLGIAEFEPKTEGIIRDNAKNYDIVLKENLLDRKFQELLIKLKEKFNKGVVILIDEYDKPILDNIDDLKEAEKIKKKLKNFYAVMKDNDEYIKFIFITGVTKFSQVSIFSGLNNLLDISLDPNFGTLCGYTEQEIKNNFQEYLKDVNFEELKKWYNGYNFLGTEKVFNPIAILKYLNSKKFQDYWFQTGTPTFLIQLLRTKEYNISKLEEVETGGEIINAFEIENIDINTLLYQAGYLTIKNIYAQGEEDRYKLTIPNLEVRTALNNYILKDYFQLRGTNVELYKSQVYQVLARGDPEGFVNILKSLFSGIPYHNFVNNDISKYEGFYASVIYSFLAGRGFQFTAEDVTSTGRIDMSIKIIETSRIYIIEFKTGGTTAEAMEQIHKCRYYDKYKGQGEITLIAIIFDENIKNINEYLIEKN